MTTDEMTLITKTCQRCGQTKPLDAFVRYIAEDGGQTFGHTCSSCRQAMKDAAEEVEDPSRSSPGGARLGNNERVGQFEEGKQKKLREARDRYTLIRDENRALQTKAEKTAEAAAETVKQRGSSLFGVPEKKTTTQAAPAQPANKWADHAQAVTEDLLKSSNTQAATAVARESEALEIFASQNAAAPVSATVKKVVDKLFPGKLKDTPLARHFKLTFQHLNAQAAKSPGGSAADQAKPSSLSSLRKHRGGF